MVSLLMMCGRCKSVSIAVSIGLISIFVLSGRIPNRYSELDGRTGMDVNGTLARDTIWDLRFIMSREVSMYGCPGTEGPSAGAAWERYTERLATGIADVL